jgi:3-phosphoshikimate 1-carboxyvinyltransferase
MLPACARCWSQRVSGARDYSVAETRLADPAVIRLAAGPLAAHVHVPGSKSITNRALLVAALARGETTLTGALASDDTAHFSAALRQLGFEVAHDAGRAEMRVVGQGGLLPASAASVFVGNAGTAARFLTALLTLGQGEYTLDGSPRMRERPIADLISALSQLGATVSAPTGCPPVQVRASGLAGGTARVAGDVSSQFLSAVLMVAPAARGPVTIELTGPLSSRPYVDLTVGVMEAFGMAVRREGYARFAVRPQAYQAQPAYAIEPDASAASYFFAAPAIAGGWVQVEGLTRRSLQGDVTFVDLLAAMGCRVDEGDNWLRVTGPGVDGLRGIDVDLADLPDTAQTLAAVAPFARTPTTIRGIATARLKETDRIAATCGELRRLGAAVDELPDGLRIYPAQQLGPAVVQTYDDHRMAMAFALVGLRVPGVRIADPGCVAKTFPGYFDVLAGLGAA